MSDPLLDDLRSGASIIHQTPHVVFGVDQRIALREVVSSLGGKVLVCTDSRMVETPIFEELLPAAGDGVELSIYSEVEPELPLGNVAALQDGVDLGAVDVIVGIGGGSCMDMAKIAAAISSHGGEAVDYLGEEAVPGPVKPIVTVPSTAGTGAEVTSISVMTDEEHKTKVGAASRYLQPHTAIVDPALTLSCPPGLTAHTGADALSHLIEAFTATSFGADGAAQRQAFYAGKSLLTDTHCRVGLSLIDRYLRRAVEQPDDVTARAAMAFAALNAGMAINTAGTAGLHAVQGPVGNVTKSPHGVGIGVLLRYVVRFTVPARRAAFEELAGLWQLEGTGDRAELAILRIDEILDSVGIPGTIADLGVNAEDIPGMAAAAMGAGRLVRNSPVEMTEENVSELFERALRGDRTTWQ